MGGPSMSNVETCLGPLNRTDTPVSHHAWKLDLILTRNSKRWSSTDLQRETPKNATYEEVLEISAREPENVAWTVYNKSPWRRMKHGILSTQIGGSEQFLRSHARHTLHGSTRQRVTCSGIMYRAARNPFWSNSPSPPPPPPRKPNSNHVNNWNNGQILYFRKKSPERFFFWKHVGLVNLAGLRVLKHFLWNFFQLLTFRSLFTSFIFSTLLVHRVSSLFSLPFAFLSCLVSPLASSLASLSWLLFWCLVLFCLLFSCLLCCLLFSLCPCLLSLSLSPCGVAVLLLCCVVWHRENPVCPLKTCPCARSKRSRVYWQHAHTWGRYERTHGHVVNVHTAVRGRVIASYAYPNFST